MKQIIKCEICGKELKRGLNFHSLFGQPACSDECMNTLSIKQQKKTFMKTKKRPEGE